MIQFVIRSGKREVDSGYIGELVMQELKRLDKIAHAGDHAPSLTPTAEDEVSNVAPGLAPDASDAKRAVVR